MQQDGPLGLDADLAQEPLHGVNADFGPVVSLGQVAFALRIVTNSFSTNGA